MQKNKYQTRVRYNYNDNIKQRLEKLGLEKLGQEDLNILILAGLGTFENQKIKVHDDTCEAKSFLEARKINKRLDRMEKLLCKD